MVRTPQMPRTTRRRLLRKAIKTKSLIVIRRVQVIVSIAAGRAVQETAEVVGCTRSHVYDTLAAFERDDLFCQSKPPECVDCGVHSSC